MGDADLTGMDRESAREYVYHYVLALQTVRRQKDEAGEELVTWQKRIELAREQGKEDLVAEATKRWNETREKLETLTAEEQERAREVAMLKEQLERLQAQPERSVNAEALLEQLESIVGERDATSEEIRKLEAESALDELKKKLEQSEESDQ